MRASTDGFGPRCGSSPTTGFLRRTKGLGVHRDSAPLSEYYSPLLSYQRRVDADISLTPSPFLAIFPPEVLVVAVNFFHSRGKNIHSGLKIFASIKADQA